MIVGFLNRLYGSTPAQFESVLTLDDSVQCLTKVTCAPTFLAGSQETAVGDVSKDWVSLARNKPGLGNAFKPRFTGWFILRQGQVVLTGSFTTALYVKVFMAIWFGGLILWTYRATSVAMHSHLSHQGVIFPIFGLLMIGVGIAFVWFATRLSAGDIDYLSSVIRGALSTKAVEQTASAKGGTSLIEP